MPDHSIKTNYNKTSVSFQDRIIIAYTLVWPKKLKVGNAWLYKAVLVKHKEISLCA